MEKQNNIVLAPCATQVTELYNLWRENHTGRLTDFYKFMVNPSLPGIALYPLWRRSMS